MGALDALSMQPEEAQQQAGYVHTLREIRQQPATWRATALQMQLSALEGRLERVLEGCRSLALTGSGSSEYAGNCLALPLSTELGIPVEAVPAGSILTHGSRALPPGRPGLLVSLARSGDSPESCAAVESLLATDTGLRHLAITCNRNGRLAMLARERGFPAVTLDERTNDRSLVMTSSFTNMVLAGRALGLHADPERYRGIAENLGRAAEHLLAHHADALAAVARSRFAKAVFLGSGVGVGAAREAALKVVEMNAGRITAMPESFLGLRHGPLSALDAETLVVAFLSSDPLARAYELDLLEELDRKRLGLRRVVVCDGVPAGLAPGGAIIDCPGLAEAGDDSAAPIYVMTGQLLAFFRCLAEGLRPDCPSDGVINRVVNSFTIHRRTQEVLS